MASFNRVIMVGNLTKDPELKQLGVGQSVCRLSIASNRQFKNKQTGIMTQEVCYIDVDVWGPQAETSSQYLQKGRPVLVEGRLKYDSWKDTDGNNRYRHSIVAERVVFLSNRQEGELGMDEDKLASVGGVPSFESQQMAEAPRDEKRASKKSTASSAGSAKFKDVQPFEDDLPF